MFNTLQKKHCFSIYIVTPKSPFLYQEHKENCILLHAYHKLKAIFFFFKFNNKARETKVKNIHVQVFIFFYVKTGSIKNTCSCKKIFLFTQINNNDETKHDKTSTQTLRKSYITRIN